MPRSKRKKTAVGKSRTPTSRSSLERETVVMFVDIMGASEVSNHKKPDDYAAFVNGFQQLFNDTCGEYVEAWLKSRRDYVQYSARGDEGLLMMYSEGDTGEAVDLAIHIALDLKRRWLCHEENGRRIKEAGLLPIDLGIGIHTGVTYLEKREAREGNPGGYEPEGYTINLAKRVEAHSREGTFTHIFLSEAAHGHVSRLADEMTYLFDLPHGISPKGISRNIRVYEVKHHFVPSDWREESKRSGRARTLLKPDATDEATLVRALAINPTNVWLLEECIRSSLLRSYSALSDNDRESAAALRTAFEPARELALRLGQSERRDAGSLFIQGLVEGECSDYVAEREKYKAAIHDTDQLGEAYWYLGLSYSYELYDETGDVNISREKLPERLRDFPAKAIDCFSKAKTRRPQCAWMFYDYGCEVVRWAASSEQKSHGLDQIELAVGRLPDIVSRIPEEPYLEQVLDNPVIERLLSLSRRPN